MDGFEYEFVDTGIENTLFDTEEIKERMQFEMWKSQATALLNDCSNRLAFLLDTAIEDSSTRYDVKELIKKIDNFLWKD